MDTMIEKKVEQPAPDPTIPPQDELILLSPAACHFRLDTGRLQMRQDGIEGWREVKLLLLFPLSQSRAWVSVLTRENKELGVFEDLKGMAHDDLHLVERELERRYLVPEITRIVSCRDKFDLVEFVVETDRGPMTFMMRNPHDSIQQVIPGRYALTDVEGNRYDVVDIQAIDAESRRMLDLRM